MIYVLVAALCIACVVIGFFAGYGLHASREPRPGYLAGPFTGGRR